MNFIPTRLPGAFLVELTPYEDERGTFARMYCQDEFEAHGLVGSWRQCNISYNRMKGTVRGLHFQLPPYLEDKLIRCNRGRIYDVILDLRQDSETYLQWLGVELTPESRRLLYVPKGFANGFQTLDDDTEVFYQVSESFHPFHYTGVCWNDPAFGIRLPLEVTQISKQDQSFPPFRSVEAQLGIFSTNGTPAEAAGRGGAARPAKV